MLLDGLLTRERGKRLGVDGLFRKVEGDASDSVGRREEEKPRGCICVLGEMAILRAGT